MSEEEVNKMDCSPGHYCQGGAKISNPTDLATEGGSTCAKNQECPAGSAAPTACKDGFYEPRTKSSAC